MSRSIRRIFPKSFNENLAEYPRETTTNGVRYRAKISRSMGERIFWIMIFIVSMSSLGYCLNQIVHEWLENSVTITDQDLPTKIFQIPFPAVTICPQIKFKVGKLNLTNFDYDFSSNYSDFVNTEFGKKFIMASQTCHEKFGLYIWGKMPHKILEYPSDYYKHYYELPDDWINTLRDMSPKLDEVFETCELASYVLDYLSVPFKGNCERLFSPIITNEGICFTFNTIRDLLRVDSLQTEFQYYNNIRKRDGWDPEIGYTKAHGYPYKGIVGLKMEYGTNGLKFVLNADVSDVTPFCNPQTVGYKIALHSPSAYPNTYENFIPIRYGYDYRIAVIPKTIKTAENLRSITSEVRQCYFNDERKLKFYTFYNEQNCRLECYANYSAMFFERVAFSSPRDSNTTNCILPYKNYGWDLPNYFELYHDYVKMFDTLENTTDFALTVNCDCLPECNSINFGYKILNSNDPTFEMPSNGTEKTLSINRTTVEIIFNASTFIGQERMPEFTAVTVILDFGGMLVLFIGGALLSVLELCNVTKIRNCFKSQLPN